MCIDNDGWRVEGQKEDREEDPGNMACKQCEAGNQRRKKKEQTKNHLNTIRSTRAELVQGACTLFLPLLLAHPHVVLVGDLRKVVLARAGVK